MLADLLWLVRRSLEDCRRPREQALRLARLLAPILTGATAELQSEAVRALLNLAPTSCSVLGLACLLHGQSTGSIVVVHASPCPPSYADVPALSLAWSLPYRLQAVHAPLHALQTFLPCAWPQSAVHSSLCSAAVMTRQH